MPNSITVNKDPYGVYTETKDPYGIYATTKDPYGVYEKLELRPAHEPFQPKQEPFLSGVSKDIYRGLAESPYLEPLEGYGFAGDVSNIIRQPIRAVGQIASIPFAGMPPPDIGFSDIEDLIKEEGIPNAITKYGLDIVMMAAAKIGIPIEPLLRRYGIPPVFSGILRSVARGSLGRRMKGVAPAEAPAKAEVPLKPVSPVKPKPEITPEMFEKTQAIPLSEVERASQMKDIMREKMRKEIVEGAPELPKAEPLAVKPAIKRTQEIQAETKSGELARKGYDISKEQVLNWAEKYNVDLSKGTPSELGDYILKDKAWVNPLLKKPPPLGAEAMKQAKEVKEILKAKEPPQGSMVGGYGAKKTSYVYDKGWKERPSKKPVNLELGKKLTEDYFKMKELSKKPPEGGTALYSGIPIPEMVKLLKNVSKESVEAVKLLLEKYDVPEAFRIAVERGLVVLPAAKKETGGFRERGFVTSVKGQFPGLTKVQGQYIPRPTDPLAQKARTLIQTDMATADRIAKTRTDDVAVAINAELIKHYNELMEKAPIEQQGLFSAKAAEYANPFSAKLTELGRGVQAATILGRLTPEGQLIFAAREIQRYNEKIIKRGWGKTIPELTGEQAQYVLQESKRINELPDGIAKAMAVREFQNYMSDLVPSPLYKKIIQVWKANLLTGMKTFGLNEAANSFHGLFEIAKDVPAVGTDMVAELFTGKRSLAFTVRGVPKGFVEGAEKGWRYWKTGFDERDVGIKLDYRRVNFGKSKLAKAIQWYVSKPFRGMGAGDQPFFYTAMARSLWSQGIAKAKNARLKGLEAKKFIEDLVANPTDEMLQYAATESEIAVFQNRTLLGQAARAIQKIPGGEVVVPFGRTPAAVAMQLVNYSPVGIVKTIVENIGKGKFDQRLFSQAMGRGLTGTAILYIGQKLFEKNLITLEYPKGEKEQKQWELEGKKPNSIKVGGAWRNPNVLGPPGMVLLVGGYYQQGLDETGSVFGAWAKAMAGGAKSLSEQTFLKGLNSAIDALNDPSRFSSGFITGLSGSIVPTIIGDVARATDITERRIESPLQSIKSRIPGLRQTLEPRISAMGEQVERGGSFLETMIDPTRPSKIKRTPLTIELRRLWDKGYKVTPTLLGDRKGYKELTSEQNTELWELTGTTIQTILNRIIQTSGYPKLSDEWKGKIITKVINEVKVRSRARIIERAIQGMSREEKKNKLKEFVKGGLLNRDVLSKMADLQANNQ